jgi:hypothetical protein
MLSFKLRMILDWAVLLLFTLSPPPQVRYLLDYRPLNRFCHWLVTDIGAGQGTRTKRGRTALNNGRETVRETFVEHFMDGVGLVLLPLISAPHKCKSESNNALTHFSSL